MKNKDLLHYDKISRRFFIKAIGGGLVAVPILESLVGEKAFAATLNSKRFIGVTTPNQLSYASLCPEALMRATAPSEFANIVKSKVDSAGWNYRRADLASLVGQSGQISDLLDSKFNKYTDQLLLYKGIDFPGRVDHGRAATMGNIAGSLRGKDLNLTPQMTIDEFMAESSKFYSQGRGSVRKDILRLGEVSISTNSLNGSSDRSKGLGIDGANSGLSFNGNLKLAFDGLFSTGNLDDEGKQKNIVDRILTSVNTLRNRSGMGSSDKIRLEQYTDNLHDLSKALGSDSAATCNSTGIVMPDLAPYRMGSRADGATLVPLYYKNLVKLLGLALRCGATKISTIGVGSSLISDGSSASQNGEPRAWHLLHAHGDKHNELLTMNKWIVDNLVYGLAEELNQVEGTGSTTYLDNTTIYFSPECSYGHSGEGSSGFILGGKNTVKSGYALDYSNFALKTVSEPNRLVKENVSLALGIGMPVNRLFDSILRSVGLDESDYRNKLGASGGGFGAWPGTYNNGYESVFGDISRSNPSAPLPDFLI